MRLIGNLDDLQETRRFVGFLQTKRVQCRFELEEDDQPDGPWELWIQDEEGVAPARRWYAEFQSNPNDPQFDVTLVEIPKVTRDPTGQRTTLHSARQSAGQGKPTGRQAVPLGSHFEGKFRQARFPVTIALIVISIVASLLTHFGHPKNSGVYGKLSLSENVYQTMTFVTRDAYSLSYEDPFVLIRKGQIWRWITPMFLHGDEKHLAFNMLWLFFLGSAIERSNGSFFFLTLTLFTQIGGALLQVLIPDAAWIPETLHGSPFMIGASGAVYGLFGFLWIRPYFDPHYPVYLVPLSIVLMIGWLFACMTPMVENVANGAHLGGLLSGMLIGALIRLGKNR